MKKHLDDNNTGSFPKGSRCSVPFKDGYQYNGTVKRIGVGERLVAFDGAVSHEQWVPLQHLDAQLAPPRPLNVVTKSNTASTLGWVLLIIGGLVIGSIALLILIAIIAACPPLGIPGAIVIAAWIIAGAIRKRGTS